VWLLMSVVMGLGPENCIYSFCNLNYEPSMTCIPVTITKTALLQGCTLDACDVIGDQVHERQLYDFHTERRILESSMLSEESFVLSSL
jgi:hypothetical protein